MLSPRFIPIVSWMLISCLMLQSRPVQGKDFQAEWASPRINCPPGSVSFKENCYAFFLTEKSWMEASTACQMWRSSHLASVSSAFEASFLASLLKGERDPCEYIWIGLHDPTEKGNGWRWSNGAVLNYFNWEKTPPSSPHPGYCGSILNSSDYKHWKDLDCDMKLPYICMFKSSS